MEPISIIVHAVLTGLQFVADKGAGEMVKDAYANLKKHLLKKLDSHDLAGPRPDEKLEDWTSRLEQLIKTNGLDKDPALVANAERFLSLVTTTAKFNVNIHGSVKSFIQGDGSQINVSFIEPNKDK